MKGKIEYVGMVRGKQDPVYLALREKLKKLAPELVKDQLSRLFGLYQELKRSGDPQARGLQLERLLNLTFRHFGIESVDPFRRNEGAEQIDGAFKLDGGFYIVECRWRQRFSDMAALDQLGGKVGRSARQTMGLFLSINGWSDNVPGLLKQNRNKAIFLMDGCDLDAVLRGQVDLRELIEKKLKNFSLKGEPFYSASQLVHDAAIPKV